MPGAYDIDSELLFEQFLARARAGGLQIRRSFGIEAIDHRDGV